MISGWPSTGRPIDSGDARPTERVAASLVRERNFDLDEFPDVEEPFARTVGAHRVSIYPVASAVVAAPVFALAADTDSLDELIDQRREQLQGEATQIGLRLYAEKPRPFEGRLQACWQASRMERNLRTETA